MSQAIYYPCLDVVRSKAQALEQQIQDQIKNQLIKDLIFTDDINQSNVILVGGGDGFLLQTVRKYHKYQKIFFGVNCGTLGFLLNKIDDISQLPTNLEDIQTVSDKLVKLVARKKNGKTVQEYFVNDIVVGNTLSGMNYLKISDGVKSENIEGTGLLISTAIGCTGYNAANQGPYLKFDDEERAVSGIACGDFRPAVIPKKRYIISAKSRDKVNIFVDGNSNIIKDILEFEISSSQEQIILGFSDIEEFKKRRRELYNQKIGGKRIVF